MKKILKIGLVLLMVVFVATAVYAELKCTLKLNVEEKEISKNTEFVVKADLSGIESEKGIITLGAELKYDDDNLEFVKVEGKNGWTSPSYNEENGKLVMDKNAPTTDDGTALEITFKTKDTAKKDVEITLKGISASDGDDEVKLDDVTTKITIKGGSSSEDEEKDNTTKENTAKTNTTTPIGSSTNTNIVRNTATTSNNTTNTATVASTDIPKAGDTNIVIMVFVVATAALGTLYFGKLNEIKKKEHDMNIEK